MLHRTQEYTGIHLFAIGLPTIAVKLNVTRMTLIWHTQYSPSMPITPDLKVTDCLLDQYLTSENDQRSIQDTCWQQQQQNLSLVTLENFTGKIKTYVGCLPEVPLCVCLPAGCVHCKSAGWFIGNCPMIGWSKGFWENGPRVLNVLRVCLTVYVCLHLTEM